MKAIINLYGRLLAVHRRCSYPMRLINVQHLNETSFLYFHLKSNCKLSRLKTSTGRVLLLYQILWCINNVIIYPAITRQQDVFMPFCEYNPTAVKPNIALWRGCRTSINFVAINVNLMCCCFLVVSAGMPRMAKWCAREASSFAFACSLAMTSISAFTIWRGDK